jgi:hypothetical protein
MNEFNIPGKGFRQVMKMTDSAAGSNTNNNKQY